MSGIFQAAVALWFQSTVYTILYFIFQWETTGLPQVFIWIMLCSCEFVIFLSAFCRATCQSISNRSRVFLSSSHGVILAWHEQTFYMRCNPLPIILAPSVWALFIPWDLPVVVIAVILVFAFQHRSQRYVFLLAYHKVLIRLQLLVIESELGVREFWVSDIHWFWNILSFRSFILHIMTG